MLNTNAEILYKNYNLLSVGEQVKILLISLFLKDNNFLLIDEPLNYIDIITREQIENSILKYKPTIIFVEHDETFVSNIANKIINLEKF